MPSIRVGTENSADIELHYKDHGAEVNSALLSFLGSEATDRREMAAAGHM
jgi:hypothetical protein